MNVNTKSYNSIDLMKFLMALVVVSIHTEPFWYTTNLSLLYAVETLRNIAVPFFFIATGFLLVKKEENGADGVIKKHMFKTLKLYLVLSLAYLPLAIYYYFTRQKGFLFSVIHYIRGLVVTGEHYNSWMLWYLLGAFYYLFVFSFFDKLKFDHKKTPVVLLIFGMVFTCLISILQNSNEVSLSPSLLSIKNIISDTIVDDRLFRPFVYISMGMLIARAKKKLVVFTGIPALVIGYIFTLISYTYGIEWRYALIVTRTVWIILGAYGLFSVSILLSLKDNPVYGYLRSLSSFMYFSHMWIWTCLYYFIYGEKTYGMMYFVATVGISVLIGTIIYVVKKRRRK